MRLLTVTGPEIDDDALLALRRAPSPDRVPDPWVRAVFVSSLDGAATLDGRAGGLGTPADQRQFTLARTDADVILVGAGTIRAEGYEGPLVGPAARARREEAGLPAHPAVAVVSGSLDLDPDGDFLRQAPMRPLILTTQTALERRPDRADALAARADVVASGAEVVEAPALVDALTARGHRVLHCEGGPRLFGTLAAADLVDELLLTISPLLAGGDGPRVLSGGDGPGLPARLRPHHVLAEDGELYLRLVHERHAAVLAEAPGLEADPADADPAPGAP